MVQQEESRTENALNVSSAQLHTSTVCVPEQ